MKFFLNSEQTIKSLTCNLTQCSATASGLGIICSSILIHISNVLKFAPAEPIEVEIKQFEMYVG